MANEMSERKECKKHKTQNKKFYKKYIHTYIHIRKSEMYVKEKMCKMKKKHEILQ